MDESTLRERARKNLLIAESLQIMTLTHSVGTGCTEVRLYYIDPLNGRERFLALGANWEEAETFLANPLYQGVRERFEGTLRQASVEKFEQLATACFHNGPSLGPRDARIIEHCRQKYAIPSEVAERVLARLTVEGTAEAKVAKPRVRPAWLQVLYTRDGASASS